VRVRAGGESFKLLLEEITMMRLHKKIGGCLLGVCVVQFSLAQEPPKFPTPVSAARRPVCPNMQAVIASALYPPEAIKLGINDGEVHVAFVISTNNEVREITIRSSTNAVFEPLALTMVAHLKCEKYGSADQPVVWPIHFKLED
jgi:TonB family protein